MVGVHAPPAHDRLVRAPEPAVLNRSTLLRTGPLSTAPDLPLPLLNVMQHESPMAPFATLTSRSWSLLLKLPDTYIGKGYKVWSSSPARKIQFAGAASSSGSQSWSPAALGGRSMTRHRRPAPRATCHRGWYE